MDSLSMGRMVGDMSQREYPWVKEDKELMESDPDPKTFKDSIWAKNDKPIKDEPMLAVFNDKYPCKEGHKLYITKMPKDAPGGIGYAFQEAFRDGMEMIKQGKIDGFNLGMNIGAPAGQSVFWPHVHFIPRHEGDQKEHGFPRGVRQAYPPDPYNPDNKKTGKENK